MVGFIEADGALAVTSRGNSELTCIACSASVSSAPAREMSSRLPGGPRFLCARSSDRSDSMGESDSPESASSIGTVCKISIDDTAYAASLSGRRTTAESQAFCLWLLPN